jgi:hypothetical protein
MSNKVIISLGLIVVFDLFRQGVSSLSSGRVQSSECLARIVELVLSIC